MIMNYAIIDSNGFVINTIVYNGIDTWEPPVDCIAVEIPTDLPVSTGWIYADSQFNPPA